MMYHLKLPFWELLTVVSGDSVLVSELVEGTGELEFWLTSCERFRPEVWNHKRDRFKIKAGSDQLN